MKRSGFCRLLAIIIIPALVNSCSKNNNFNSGVPAPPGSTDILTDVVYGQNTDWQGHTQDLTMDIYLPANRTAGAKYPLVILMHSGDFLNGDKENLAGKCQILADSGFIAATINYRMGWDHAMNCAGDTLSLHEASYRAIQDANAATRFLVSKANDYGIDTNWIFNGGMSAGAVMALNMDYLTDDIARITTPATYNKLGGLNNASNNLTNKFSFKGTFSIAGALTDSTLITASNAIPAIFFQGDADPVIPVDQGYYLQCPNYGLLYGSLCLFRQLATYKTPTVAHILHGSGHENSETTGYNDAFTMSNTACMFQEIIRREKLVSKIYYDYEYSCQ